MNLFRDTNDRAAVALLERQEQLSFAIPGSVSRGEHQQHQSKGDNRENRYQSKLPGPVS